MAKFKNENRLKTAAGDFNPPALSHLQIQENRILDYLEDQMPAAERRAVEEHLAICPECQDLFQQLKQLDAALAQGLPRPALSPEFNTRLWRRIEAEAMPRPVLLRSQLKQQLEKEFQARSAQLRKNFLPRPELLEGLGYAAAAGVAAYFLFQQFAGLFADPVKFAPWPDASQTLWLAYVPATICLLGGLGFALRRQIARWWAIL